MGHDGLSETGRKHSFCKSRTTRKTGEKGPALLSEQQRSNNAAARIGQTVENPAAAYRLPLKARTGRDGCGTE
jgi:hypothetical protein